MHAIDRIKYFVKYKVLFWVSGIRYPFAKAYNASGDFFCPVCDNNVRQFKPFGSPPRPHAKCPVCGSLERHRLDWMFFKQRTNLFDQSNKKMLHVAPEPFLSQRLCRIKELDYLTADLLNPFTMVKMDITDISYPDNCFDVIYCSHVLEHIENDRQAIAELFRVLRPGNWAVLQVPIMSTTTYEDPTIIDPRERKKHFGQRDHVRRCGPDYAERISKAGFIVQIIRSTDLVTEADCARMSFDPDRLIFFCKKPAQDHD